MTDLEMVRLCAEAMGLRPIRTLDLRRWYCLDDQGIEWHYDPLEHDGQAMALLKRFRPDIYMDSPPYCRVILGEEWDVTHTDLNRAIVECVAVMQAAKVTT